MVDRAETGDLAKGLGQIGHALDEFLEFSQPDAYLRRDAWRDFLDRPLPQDGIGAKEVLDQLCRVVVPNGSAIPRPGFTGFITTGAVTLSALASAAASIAAPQRYLLTAFNFLEELSLDWLAELFSLSDMKGVYSSGGSVANLIALSGARQAAYESVGCDPALDGVPGSGRIYASEHCHRTIQRSAGVLGLGRNSVRAIPVDAFGQMRPDLLLKAIETDLADGILPVAVVGNAGSTDTGAIDPLEEIGTIANDHKIWFHIDGAYGLPGILDPRKKHRYKGLERADSVIVDPHKWLGASVGIAATFVRDRSVLGRALTQEPAAYLEGSFDESDAQHSLDSLGIPYFDYSVELSAPSRGVVIWALLQEIGVEGLRERVCRHNDLANLTAQIAEEHSELELLLTPTLSICCFRYVSDKTHDIDGLNEEIMKRLKMEGRYLPSTTRIDGKLAIRPCYIGARTTEKEARGLMQSVLRFGQIIVSELPPSADSHN